MQIAVYTISKNELQHCERWTNSVLDADYRIVLDTGSTDGTVEKLRELGVTVYEKSYDTWRFDIARNDALNLIPESVDICISMDMDEFMSPGWRTELEKTWASNTTKIGYSYVFNYDSNLTKQNSYYADKIHSRRGYEWRRPVHETIFPLQEVAEVVSNNLNIVMNQIQDVNKTTRKNYLNLLRLAYQENQTDTQIVFWLARELFFNNEYDESIKTIHALHNLLNVWHIEKSESYVYLSKMIPQHAYEYLMQAMLESPARREIWVELSQYFYNKNDWINLLWSTQNGIERSFKHNSYLDRQDSWDNKLYDLASLAAWNLGWKDKAREYCEQALIMNPTDVRLRNNLTFMVN